MLNWSEAAQFTRFVAETHQRSEHNMAISRKLCVPSQYHNHHPVLLSAFAVPNAAKLSPAGPKDLSTVNSIGARAPYSMLHGAQSSAPHTQHTGMCSASFLCSLSSLCADCSCSAQCNQAIPCCLQGAVQDQQQRGPLTLQDLEVCRLRLS